MTNTGVAVSHMRFFSRRRRLRRRVVWFSIAFSLAVLLLTGIVLAVVDIYVPCNGLKERSQRAFDKTRCEGQKCDIADLVTGWEFVGPGYLLDMTTLFVLNVNAEGKFSDLRRSDSGFVERFQTPRSIVTPSGESWRLYSVTGYFCQKPIAIMAGYAEKASWKLDLPVPLSALVDERLKEQVARITAALAEYGCRLDSLKSEPKLAVDGYEVVDLDTDDIVLGGYDIPVFLSRGTRLPRQGLSFRFDGLNLYVVRTDIRGRLLARSSYLIGNTGAFLLLFSLLLAVAGLTAYFSGHTFLRRYFVMAEPRACTVEEAIERGEGPSIEFKRSVSLSAGSSAHQVLETIAAFANTGDGTILLGIEDDGKVRGIAVDNAKARDQLSSRLFGLVRQEIKPPPAIQIDYVNLSGVTICRILVPRGEEPLYFLDGAIYVRDGASDIKAQPAIVKRLLAEHGM
jgi:hypothetical protein